MAQETIKVKTDVLEAWRTEELLNFKEFSEAVGCCVETAKKMLRGDLVARKVVRKAASAMGVPARELVVIDEAAHAVA